MMGYLHNLLSHWHARSCFDDLVAEGEFFASVLVRLFSKVVSTHGDFIPTNDVIFTVQIPHYAVRVCELHTDYSSIFSPKVLALS